MSKVKNHFHDEICSQAEDEANGSNDPANYEPKLKRICVNAHDGCSQMTECPVCEWIPDR